jgi:hypothetical protein
MDWSIKIIPAATGGGAAFKPDLKGARAGSALKAQQDDLVSWNNTTTEAHQPWQTDSAYQPLSDAFVKANPSLYMSDPVPAGQSSSPAYDVAQPGGKTPPPSWTIYYFCKTHPNRTSERGTITATIVPTS